MATIRAFIRVSGRHRETAHIRFRLRDGRKIQLLYTSRLTVRPDCWNPRKEEIGAKATMSPIETAEFNKSVADMKKLIMDIYNSEADKSAVSSEWLRKKIEYGLNMETHGVENDFFISFRRFLDERKMSEMRKRNFLVLYRDLQRFETYMSLTKSTGFRLTFEALTDDALREFESFLRNEHSFFMEDGTTAVEYEYIYKASPETRKPKRRGRNTINGLLTKLRTFFRWAVTRGMTDHNPFSRFHIVEAVYGTPYYLTIEERNRLYDTDFSASPSLGVQRDIFVFQCLVGCRVSDLYGMTRKNIINDAVEYIPRKTKDGRPVTVRVPLNGISRKLLAKYEHSGDGRILPFVSKQKYNRSIKKMLATAGLTRPVVILNPTTSREEIMPINEIASSHLARRTFVGNLYRKVKDPSLVGALSGHKEGSRAFARYRDIDDEIKRQLVELLE